MSIKTNKQMMIIFYPAFAIYVGMIWTIPIIWGFIVIVP